MDSPHHGASLRTVPQVPNVPGWITSREDITDRPRLAAVRVADLDDYQRAHGCAEKVTAGSRRELEVLCMAQWALAELLAAARTAGDAEQGAVHAAWHAYGVLLAAAEGPV